ncbi:MAG: hypothetical protein HDR23_00865 [Lachnospiraceae bacterium]|nr:hypothetical protein [Lachnospiraceae bacterium]
MIQVLIVDDNVRRTQQVRKLLAEADIPEQDVTSVASVSEAKRQLIKMQYHVLVLDLVLPDWDGEEPTADGGIRFLQEINSMDKYKMPDNIFVLSESSSAIHALESIRDKVGGTSDSIRDKVDHTPIQCATGDDSWRIRLEARIKQVLENKILQQKVYDYDAAVICALEEPELAEVKHLPFGWKPYMELNTSVDYFVGNFANRKVVCAASYEMGLSAAAILASEMIARFRPRYLVMTGIAGGVDKKKLNYGDIMVADPCFDYDSGKKVFEHGKSSFKPDYRQIRLDETVHKIVRRLKNQPDALRKIYSACEYEKPNQSPKIEIGPFGSGAFVLADPNVIDRVQTHNRKFMGFDMEAYAVMLAGRLAAEPKPTSIIMKSVSDFGNGKTDKYQKYAAYTSARVLELLLQELFENRESE